MARSANDPAPIGLDIGQGKRPTLHRLQRDLLCEQDVTSNEVACWRETPLRDDATGRIELVNVRDCAACEAVSLSRIAADHIELRRESHCSACSGVNQDRKRAKPLCSAGFPARMHEPAPESVTKASVMHPIKRMETAKKTR
jgi:hypothetical protein